MDMKSDRSIFLIALAIAAILFFGSHICGYVVSVLMPDTAREISWNYFSTIETDGLSPLQESLEIFFNNLQIDSLMFLGGMTFGIVTLLLLVSNGLVIGTVVGCCSSLLDGPTIVAALVPHGLFEYLATLIAATLGLQIGYSLYLGIRGNDNFIKSCLQYGTKFLLVVVPLTFIAALVEVYITPGIMALASGA